MNILFLTYSFLPAVGGVQRSVFNLAVRFREEGHDVTVVTHKPDTVAWSCARTGGVPVVYLNIPNQFPRGWADKIRTVLLNATNTLILVTLCRWKRIHIVHFQHLNVDTHYAGLLRNLTKSKCVLTLRGGETEEWIAGRAERTSFVIRQLRAADRITAVSQALLDEAARLFPETREKSAVIPNPIDPDRLANEIGDREPRAAGSVPYFIFVGRLEPMKGIECLIDAVHALVAERPDFRPKLVIVGSGTLESQLIRLASDGAGRDRFEFIGLQSHAETLQLIRGALFLILPSIYSEGCPNVVLEAMALKTPVLVSSHPALTEMVEDGVHGRVFRIGDKQELKNCMLGLVDDAELRAKYTAAAARRLECRYSFPKVLRAYSQLYKSLQASCRRYGSRPINPSTESGRSRRHDRPSFPS